MQKHHTHHGAVLTGDLVDSRALMADGLKSARDAVTTAFFEVNDAGASDGGAPEFFRGDSWQAFLGDAHLALRMALLVRAALVAGGLSDSRIAIAIGPVDRIDPTGVSLSTGPAFTSSGAALDGMGRARLALVLMNDAAGDHSDSRLGALASAAIGLLDPYVTGWTSRQAEVARLYLGRPGLSQTDIAEQLGTTRQSVQDVVMAARLPTIVAFLIAMEAIDWRHG